MSYVLVSHIWQTEKNSESATYAEKISWENLTWISYEKNRTGPGEQGLAYHESDKTLKEMNKQWDEEEGFFVEVSNKISLNRALPDFTPQICQTKKYSKVLPKASVIITFHNEFWSTLLRCVHSIYNRSPKELLHEIVLINDNSSFLELFDDLRNYLKNNFGDVVKLYENSERQGLIKARMTGARKATGEVIIFLDSHMEVFNSWLPPLLDTLVTHPKAAVVPVCDAMDPETFSPGRVGYGFRGMFDWNFRYQFLPLRKQDRLVEGEPYELPCLTGGYYAIRRDHFFHLGGYDEGLLIWNGENYEMCIKLWLCSGGLFQVPCSRVVHLSKHHSAHRHTTEVLDFVGLNLKRVAEVWLDDYKQHFYKGNPKRYANIDAGDLTDQFKKKKELGCKPFSHYLEVVAPDMLLRYPLTPQNFASGTIQSASTEKCLFLGKAMWNTPLSFRDCNETGHNDFILTLERSIKFNNTSDQCLSTDSLTMTNCHHQFRDQHWKFTLDSRQIKSPMLNQCLTANSTDGSIYLSNCELEAREQIWHWSYENHTALLHWDEVGIPLP